MLRKVVLLALPGVAPFEFGVICEVFGIDRSDSGGPAFDFTIATANPGPVRTSLGFDMVIDRDLSVAADADLVAVPAHAIDKIDEAYLEVIRAAEARGAWVLSVCSGAFALAQAGILDGRRSTTHWMHSDKLASRFPGTTVDPDVLFVEDRKVVTSAGTAAGIDAALHIVRKELGPRRPTSSPGAWSCRPSATAGSPSTSSSRCPSAAPTPSPRSRSGCSETSRRTSRSTSWPARPSCRHARLRAASGPTWARRRPRGSTGSASSVPRTCSRRPTRGLESIAEETGFGTAAVMRHHFIKVLQTTPTAYRRTFGERLAG